MNKEIWRDITGYEGYYQVSSEGRVKSLKRKGRKNEYILRPVVTNCGYYQVGLRSGGKRKMFFVHRLVCEAFHENPDNKPQVNHVNEDKTDNRACNLEWSTRRENMNHGTRNSRAGKAIAKANSKQTGQYTLDMELIKVWPSAREAERKTGFDQSTISKVARGKYKQAYGYIWKYI